MIELELNGARVAFSTRRGGVSEGPYESLNLGILTADDRANVTRNRAILAEGAGFEVQDVTMGWQVHGTQIQQWDAPPAPADNGFAEPGAELAKVDGHVTDREGLGLLVLGADCFPVALSGPGRVGILHCGWRGLAGGIVARGVEAFDEPPVAAVGPGIGGCCYEVSEEVLAEFADVDDAARGRMLDLRTVVEAKLRAAGVTTVEHVDLCTSCRADLFFSHRRDGAETGRQGGLVWREG